MSVADAGRYDIGIDIGGTFTDCVVTAGDGTFAVDKAFTTPGNLVGGLMSSLRNVAEQLGISANELLASTRSLKLGTTSPVNRLINRAGAQVALLTTAGHEDAVLIGRVQQKMDGLSDAGRSDLRAFGKVDPLVPRDRIFGIVERVDATGEIIAPLDEAQVQAIARDCVDRGIRAFAVCLLWSFLNPAHERVIGEVISSLSPEAFVVLSSEIAPVMGEYERAATTMLNAYLGPGTMEDFASLREVLRSNGLTAPVFVMQSSGGVEIEEEAVRRPVHLLGSGPVGGVAATRRLGDEQGEANLIATDMGGTSFDVGVIANGHAVEVQTSIHARYRVLTSAVEVVSIGAGGGSIARIDPLSGVLQVGPESAGSRPGPACYGFGGSEPTVTDANAVLGRLNAERFFAGRRRLDLDAARASIAKVAQPLGVSVESAARGIIDIVDSRMADLIRNLTVERGRDPRDFVIVAYGGGGPLHVGNYARLIGIKQAIIPRAAPVYSAWGIAHSPMRRAHARSAPALLPVATSVIAESFAEIERHVSDDGAGERSLFVDMRYRYQLQELAVPVAAGELEAPDLSDRLVERFEDLYGQRYGKGTVVRAAGVEISTYRLVVSEGVNFGRRTGSGSGSRSGAAQQTPIYFDDEFVVCPTYDADDAGPGFRASGPCAVVGRLQTIIVHAGQSISVDNRGDFVLEVAP
jgi:N-methylhydantoinase A